MGQSAVSADRAYRQAHERGAVGLYAFQMPGQSHVEQRFFADWASAARHARKKGWELVTWVPREKT